MAFHNQLWTCNLSRLLHCFLPTRNLRRLLLPPPKLNLSQHLHRLFGSCISASRSKRRHRIVIIFNLILCDKPLQRRLGEKQILRLSLLTHGITANTSAQLRLANQGQQSKHLPKPLLSKFSKFTFKNLNDYNHLFTHVQASSFSRAFCISTEASVKPRTH